MTVFDKIFGATPSVTPSNSQLQQGAGMSSRNALANQALNSAMQNQHSMMNQIGALGGYMVSSAASFRSIPLRVLTMSDLRGEAGKATLQELANLWRARWGDDWVVREDIDTEFFNIAATRLYQGDYLERHDLSDGTLVFKLLK